LYDEMKAAIDSLPAVISSSKDADIKKFVTNQCLEFGVPRVPKVNKKRMNQFLL